MRPHTHVARKVFKSYTKYDKATKLTLKIQLDRPKVMHPVREKFVCLDPKKKKHAVVETSLSQIGSIDWLKFVPMALKDFPETAERADVALRSATKVPRNSIAMSLKKFLLSKQYNWSRRYFEENNTTVAVVWNGLNGSRRVFMDGARDAGARTLFFELSPLKNRVTIDPNGVNFMNYLSRNAQAYVDWGANRGSDAWRKIRSTITARSGSKTFGGPNTAKSLSEPFIFLPLQVPGDSQMRLFGGRHRTLDQVIDSVVAASQFLPENWYIRVKEHPSAEISYAEQIRALNNPRIILDNSTDTFSQVEASMAVLTVNSSVGLEAMFFDKPVIAMGDCFWALPGVAEHCPTHEKLVALFSSVETLQFDQRARHGFLGYLVDEYYPRLDHYNESGLLHHDEVAKIKSRLGAVERAPTAKILEPLN